MIALRRTHLAAYLRECFGSDAELVSMRRVGETAAADGSRAAPVKRYGYGTPIAVTFRQRAGTRTIVLETVEPGPFGHEHRADRAAALLWDYDTYGQLPRHVRALDVGAFSRAGALVSLRDVGELFVANEWVEGEGYHRDLERIARTGRLRDVDRRRVRALSAYLAQIHRRKKRAPDLYRRRLRELIGHGECIMGLTDSYPTRLGFIDARLLRSIEDAANAWRWRLRSRSARLCVVHGDFHPWNVLFRRGVDFSVLDRSRGEWGEAADDVTAMAINFVFFSLRRYGRLAGPFAELFHELWLGYERKSGDRALRDVAAPFFAFRGLVIASPRWYPDLTLQVRRALFDFILAVMSEERFDPARVNHYLGVAG